jgi:peptidoglycan hydrolase CwlO-like protein
MWEYATAAVFVIAVFLIISSFGRKKQEISLLEDELKEAKRELDYLQNKCKRLEEEIDDTNSTLH